jgi:hypothetical protein
MKLTLYYRTIVTDKNGKVVKRSRWRKSRSFVIAYLQHIDSALAHAYGSPLLSVSIKDTGGVIRTIPGGSDAKTIMACFAPDNDDTYGIVVGTGTTAPTNTDYNLGAKIAHGTGAGQLDYGAHSRTAPTVVGANVDYVISRSFYNGSGASITVNEIGIIVSTYDTGVFQRFFLIVRDVIAPVTVNDTQTLTVQYTWRTTV